MFGSKPVPSIKLATNSLMYRHMAEDMDINCGVVLEGTPVIAIASGKRSKSELTGVGEEEFAPWIIMGDLTGSFAGTPQIAGRGSRAARGSGAPPTRRSESQRAARPPAAANTTVSSRAIAVSLAAGTSGA